MNTNFVTLNDAINQFIQYSKGCGLIINEVKADGKLHRCRVDGDRHGKTSGAYVMRPNYPFYSYIQNFKTGEIQRINFNRPSSKFLQVQNYSSTRTVTEDQEQAYRKKAYFAYLIFKNANFDFHNLKNNNYLENKQVLPFGIKYDKDDNLLIPLRDVNGKLWSLQKILPDGTKRFLAGGKKSGMFHKIGWFKLPESYSGIIYIAEGYATAASIYMATEKPCVCAFDVGNLRLVTQEIRNYLPLAHIVICADNDPKNSKGISIGIENAYEVAKKFNCQVAIPTFLDNSISTDFNDLHSLYGLTEVRRQLRI